MKKCLLIEQAEDGTVSVGFATKEDDEVVEGYDMQPADNLEAAMAQGREMLESDPEGDAEADKAFEGGYSNVAGGMEGIEGLVQ